MAAGFFYSKTFKIIATVNFTVELIITITFKEVDLYCDELDDFANDWAEKFGGGNYDGGYDDVYDYWKENYGN